MNKPIFQKIKRNHQDTVNDSLSPQERIASMSVNQMDRTLINQMNISRNDSLKRITINQHDQHNKYNDMADSRQSKNSLIGLKKVPELIFQNGQLKKEIQNLKNQKKLILNRYEDINTFNRYQTNLNHHQMNSTYSSEDKSNQFSFKKSVQNIDKLVSIEPYQKTFRQNSFNKRQSTVRNQRSIPSSDLNKAFVNQAQKRVATSLQTKAGSKIRRQASNLRLQNTNLHIQGLNQHKIGQSMRRSGSKQAFSTLQQRFYQYCKTQMVRMNTENTKLSLKIGELENKLTTIHKHSEFLQQQNSKLKRLNQHLEQKLSIQSDRISKMNEQISTTLHKKDEIISNEFLALNNQINDLKKVQQDLRKSIVQKDLLIGNLQVQNSKRQKQCKKYTQIVSKNALIQNQLTECMIRNKKLSDKFRRMPVIDHLWEIKQVEYSNLIDLIQKQKQDIEIHQSGIKKSRSSFQNGFDMSFSKQKRNF